MYSARFSGRKSKRGNPIYELYDTWSDSDTESQYFGFVTRSPNPNSKDGEYLDDLRQKLIDGEIGPKNELLVEIISFGGGNDPRGPYKFVIRDYDSSRSIKINIEPLTKGGLYWARFNFEGSKGDPAVIISDPDNGSVSYYGFVKPNWNEKLRESSDAIRKEMLDTGDTKKRYKVIVIGTPTEGNPRGPYLVVATPSS